MRKTKKTTSSEEVQEMPIYLVMCSTTIVDSEGNEKLLGQRFLALYKTISEAHYVCRDSYCYACSLCEERAEEEEDFYFDADDNELTIVTVLYQTMGLLMDDPEALLETKFEVIEWVL